MRIGLVCPYSLTMPGGVQGQVLGLARALRASGHEARVLAPCDGPPPAGWVTPVGNSILNPSNGSVAPLAPDPPAQMRTIRALWDEAFDVVHLHEPLCPGPTATALTLKSAPLVGTFHAAGEQPAYRALGWLARRMSRRLDVKVAVSPAARDLASTVVPGPFTMLFNGVEVDRFAGAEPFPGADRRRVVLFVGRHEVRKGLAVLLEALDGLPEDVVVWVAGDGPETATLQERHGGDTRIEWLGRIPDAERNARMAAADVFCAPSVGGESFGVILLEAMAAGTPVVASAIEGYVGVAGPLDGSPAAAVLTEPGDAVALGRALTTLLDDETARQRMRTLGRERANHFSMDRLAESYLELYAAVAGAGRLPA